MEEDNNINNFSAADIERYHKGLMSEAEMHALEKAAMDDPFLSDALEGYSVAGVNASHDMHDLRTRLARRTGAGRISATPVRKKFYWVRVAAMIVVIAGAGFIAYALLSKKERNIVQAPAMERKDASEINDTGHSNNLGNKTDTAGVGAGTAVSTESHAYKIDTGIAGRLQGAAAGVAVQHDSLNFSYSTANTTRDLAAENLKVIPDAKDDAGRSLALEKKNEPAKEELFAKPSAAPSQDDLEKAKQVEQLRVINSNRKYVNDYITLQKQKSGAPSSRKFSEDRRSADSSDFYDRLNIFRGRVTDASNNGIPFANVTINDVNVGTYADVKGYFSLVAPDTVLNVSLRAVGFNSSQVQLKNMLPANEVVLQEDKSIDAIVLNARKPNANRSRSMQKELTEPEPEDGWENYDSYLANNLKLPGGKDEMQRRRGEVELIFDVDAAGGPINIKVARSFCKECNEEAIRLLREGPKWKKKKKREKGRVTVAF